MKYVPDVGVPKHRATNSLPELLCVLDRRDSVSAGLAADGVACLRNPDCLSAGRSLSRAQRGLEQRFALANGVRHRVLEVGVRVHADPV